jgi:hypothetical protein
MTCAPEINQDPLLSLPSLDYRGDRLQRERKKHYIFTTWELTSQRRLIQVWIEKRLEGKYMIPLTRSDERANIQRGALPARTGPFRVLHQSPSFTEISSWNSSRNIIPASSTHSLPSFLNHHTRHEFKARSLNLKTPWACFQLHHNSDEVSISWILFFFSFLYARLRSFR